MPSDLNEFILWKRTFVIIRIFDIYTWLNEKELVYLNAVVQYTGWAKKKFPNF
jgi:hypothetical protein